MIPKIIHYCWFGHNPLPPLAKKCIASWKKYLPDYEIIEWNEDNFDVNTIPYTKEAYEAGKYAFVSDFARFWILYHYGGLYFDTDVEILKPLGDIIERGAFMGCEPDKSGDKEVINPGLGLGASKGNLVYKAILDRYLDLRFINQDGSMNLTTVVTTTTTLMASYPKQKVVKGIFQIEGINIYPSEYFCPKNYYTGVITISPQTVAIHHYDASWKSDKDKIKKRVINLLGKRLTQIIVKIKHMI